MPFDPTGKATLPPSTWATSGQTIRTEQHNPPFRDIEAMLSSVLVRDGRAPMAGNLPMNGNRITGMADGSEASDGATVGQTLPIGSLIPFAGSTAPSGFLLCYGQAVSRASYTALFDAIGTTYGAGNGTTTFNLPDLRGRVVAGRDNMGGTAAGRLTGTSGVNGTTLGAVGGDQRMQQHNHTISDPGHAHSFQRPLRQSDADRGSDPSFYSIDNDEFATTGTGYTGIVIQNTGSGASQNVQPTIIINYIIKASH